MYEHDLITLLDSMGVQKVKSSGNNLTSSCPFAPWTHAKGKDSHPSFSVLVGKENKWNCFACGQRGLSVETLISSYERLSNSSLGLSGSDKIKQKIILAGSNYSVKQSFQHGWFDFGDLRIFDISEYERFLTRIPQYAVDRGITVAQARKWRLGFNNETQRLFIPIFSALGKMVGYSERAIHEGQEPKYKHASGFKRNEFLYGMHFVDKENPIACVSEGFMDVLNLDRNGVSNVFAIMGTAVSLTQVNFLSQFKEVWIFPHNDQKDAKGNSAGMTSSLFLKAMLAKMDIKSRLAPFVEGKKDVGDWTSEELKYILGALKIESSRNAEDEDPFA